jgi:LacI family transcriptional regulator
MAALASAAGVSKSTVSIALRNSPRLPLATRRRIQNLAEQIGYRPDPTVALIAGAGWRRPRGFSGLVLAYLSGGRAANAGYEQGARARADALGYRLETFDSCRADIVATLPRVLRQRGIQGVVIAPQPGTAPLALAWSEIAAAFCGTGAWQPPVSGVVADWFGGTLAAFSEVQRRGYRRIGVVLSADDPSRRDNVARICAATYAQRSSCEAAFSLHESGPGAGQREEFSAWFHRFRPDVVMSAFPRRSPDLRSLLAKWPADLGYVALDAEPADSTVAGLDAADAAQGGRAVEIVDRLLCEHRFGPPAQIEITQLTPSWRAGASLPERLGEPLETDLPAKAAVLNLPRAARRHAASPAEAPWTSAAVARCG